MKYKTLLMFGGPGSGKGTQGALVGHIPGFFHISSGDAFRNIDRNSELGKVFLEYSSRGELLPDEVTIKMWAQVMHARTVLGHYKPDTDLLVLDGIPRTVKQASMIDAHIEVLKIIHLVCNDEDAMFERLRRRALKANRHDDADERVIRKRWRVYEDETYPVLSYYPENLVTEVDSIGSLGHILRDILEHVVPVHEAHFPAFGS